MHRISSIPLEPNRAPAQRAKIPIHPANAANRRHQELALPSDRDHEPGADPGDHHPEGGEQETADQHYGHQEGELLGAGGHRAVGQIGGSAVGECRGL